MSTEIEPAQIDAEQRDTIEVAWDGFTFTIPAQVDEWDVETLKAFEDGKAINGVQRILGASQSAAIGRHIREKHGRAARVKDYASVMENISVALGFTSTGE